jgi:hypothetical protein
MIEPNTNAWIVAGVVAVVVFLTVAVWFALFKGKGGTAPKDRQVDGLASWDPNDAPGSLAKVLRDVEAAAKSATDWYWAEKGPKARASRFIQAASVILTVSAGLVPVALELLSKAYKGDGAWWSTGLWATVLVGVAAGLLGLDRAFGFSTAWARYVIAATEITQRLAEFRMDWLALSATTSQTTPPSAEQVAALLQKAKEFRMAVEAVVVQETKDWATEFQNNLAQLEKDVKAQLDTLKAQVEKQQQAREAASEPGSIEATVSNADRAQDFTFFVSLDGPEGPVVKDERVANNKTWIRLNVMPGQYRLAVAADTVAIAAAPSKRVSQSAVVAVKTGELAKASVALPIE